jgi:hypothetical protein
MRVAPALGCCSSSVAAFVRGVVEVGGVQQRHHLHQLRREPRAVVVLVVVAGAPGSSRSLRPRGWMLK